MPGPRFVQLSCFGSITGQRPTLVVDGVQMRRGPLIGAPNRTARLETPMTGDESLQFVEYLRRHNHLMKAAANGEAAEQGSSGRQQARLWELTDLSASEFA